MDTEGSGSDLVSFDTEAVLTAALETVDGPLYALVAYTSEDFRVLHTDEQLVALYRDEEQMHEHFADLHSYVHIDFTERELFENQLFADVGEVRTFVTQMDGMTFVRLLDGDQGVFFSVAPDEPVIELSRVIERAL